MSEKRFRVRFEQEDGRGEIVNEKEDAYFIDCDDESTVGAIVDLLNEQQATIEHLTKSRDKWSQSAKLHSEYFNCLEKAIERAYKEKPYPKIDDIMNIYSKLEKELDDE